MVCGPGRQQAVSTFFRDLMAPKKKVILQPNDASAGYVSKRKSDEDMKSHHNKRSRHDENDDEDAVDYGEVDHSGEQKADTQGDTVVNEVAHTPMSAEEEERNRIAKALESWCNNNISKESEDGDVAERVAALAEVGQLLVFDMEKYPNADSMRSELEDIGSIIGGDVVVTRFINFILSLQNQLKKTRALAERHLRQQQMMHQAQFAGAHPHGFQGFTMPMMIQPGGQHMFVPGGPGMYMGQQGFPVPHGAGARGNMTLNATGEMTAVERQREKERKRKEILAECTEHLKALLERVTKTTDASDKAKIYELIDKVKKRIESLKEVTPPVAPVMKAPAPKGPIRGYYGNQYVNPKLLEQQQRQQQSQGEGGNPTEH